MTIALERLNGHGSPGILDPSTSGSVTQNAPTDLSDLYQIGNMKGRNTIPIAVNPVELVTTECITVTSSMRKHSRWAHSSVAAILSGGGASRSYERELSVPLNVSLATKSPSTIAPTKSGSAGVEGEHALASRWGLRGKKGKSLQDNPLMSAFTRLRIDLKDCKDIREFDTPALLHPFLQVIRSSSTSAPITSLALISITKFFSYNIINRDSPRLSMALQLLSAAVTHCRFEATDSAADEIVLLRILKLMEELFRVLIDLLDPHNRQHTDTMRVMSLRIIDVALEVAGPSIARHPSLAQLAKDDLCRHLFQLVRSENMALLNGSLRVAGTLLSTCRNVLKLQQELFLSYLVACLHPRVEIPREPGIDPNLYSGVPQAPKLVKPSPSQTSSGRSTPVPVKDRQKLGMEGGSRKPEAREAMVESIGALTRIPNFMAELFVNYDSEVDRADLCEDMVGLLSRNAFPDSATWSTTNVPPLCLDALLGYVQFIAERLDQPPNYDNLPDPARLRSQRQRKKVIIQGVAKFNENPKAGIAYLASHKIIEDPDNPHLVAKFLKGTSRISKRVLGEFISKKSNEALLDEFIGLLNFDGKRVDEALRDLLGSFRLPGEAPLITRILTVFSDKYITKVKPSGVADKDSLFVLTYAIIMLNTNLYNRNVKPQDRMSFEGFVKNLRGVNGGKDFDTDFLQSIYTSIQHNEIILPDEHENKHAFEYAWKELLMKTVETGELAVFDSNVFDAEMFQATWRPVVATLSYVFMSASDDAVFSRVVIGFDQCAKIAARYNQTEALDRIIYCLSSISTLAPDTPPNTSLNTEVQAGKKSVMVSELAVKLGRDFRAQLATVVLFRVLMGNESIVRKGWTHIIKILHNLFINSLIPQFESMKPKLDVPPIPLQPPSQIIDRDGRGNDSGLLSAFTSYLSSYAADDPPEPSDEELENTLCTVDCVSACSIPEILTNISLMPLESVVSLVNALLSDLPDTTPAVIVVKPERPPPNASRSPSSKTDADRPNYDPGMIYVLELATILTIRDQNTICELGETLTGALQNIVRDFKGFHSLVVSRVISYLLSLLCHAYCRSSQGRNYKITRFLVDIAAVTSTSGGRSYGFRSS
ncbi:guanine nucleotide exchange factor [Histoplasma capsulatum H143]|uniref:Guanine nucleotide exchange factor n=1 Tax=Ajellomyces capsulatus (strain H143) TaxID=544712 RepID=C6HKZ5_AJECH|nr:guanine nucleotide exchange factor [Histoplasma capsulatum H143]